jgi:cytochrome c-type biogenesis protein CcmH/NrfG
VFSRIWWGLVGITLLGLLWVSIPYFSSVYYLNKGVQLLSEDDNQRAIHHLETALRYEPTNILAYRWLAKAYLKLREPEKALEALQQALILSPNNCSLTVRVGRGILPNGR